MQLSRKASLIFVVSAILGLIIAQPDISTGAITTPGSFFGDDPSLLAWLGLAGLLAVRQNVASLLKN